MESGLGSQEELREATSGWWLIGLIGVLSFAVGVAFLFQPDDSISTLAVIAGIFLLVRGILELAASLMHGTQSRGMVALLGAITAIIGVLLIRHPVGGVTAVALLIGIWLIAVGVVRFVAAFETEESRGWNIGVGLVQVIAGVVILVDPSIGYTTLALLAGLAFIVNGVGELALAWNMHAVRREVKAS